MSSVSAWYNSQYSTWNRTRRLHTTPFLARTDTTTARAAAEMARNPETQDPAVVINMGDLNDPTANKDKKKQDSLFGPNIGVVSSGPAWTDINEKKPAVDQLTPDVVKGWIAKSKESAQPTTTLQALVNLKRPTLRLSPLAPSVSDDPTQADSHHHHGLEFEYDCDAPKCGIYVHVLVSPDHPHAEGNAEKSGLSRVLVFETVVEGGFGKILKLEEGATLELGRFEHRPHVSSASQDASTSPTSAPTQATSEATPTGTNTEAPSGRSDRRSRFMNFNFRRRSSQNRSVSGPALAVVDAEIGSGGTEGKDKENKDDQVDHGVKVTIRLAALDDEGKELASTNEQVTYLHVVRFGAVPADGVEDTRPWVVRVVKREATIGPHTFHLHEIYGLSSQSSSHAQALSPIAPAPSSPTHSYPPVPSPPSPTHEDEPSSECLLCLSSPREVVLLPCRHLVACKECAINMVEFGAGGQIVHNESETNATGAAAESGGDTTGAGETAGGEAAAPIPAVAPIPQNPRRKRKAKGWFCPVCRQPYTSLLRITTTPPSKEEKEGQEPNSAVPATAEPSSPPPAHLPAAAPRSGGFVSSLRPGFFRTFSRGAGPNAPSAEPSPPVPTLPPDLERGEAPTATATPATVTAA